MRFRSAAAPTELEWPTLFVALVIYGGWLAVTFSSTYIPTPLLSLVGGWLIAWQGSLQHETIHGHPTRNPRLNRVIGWPPLSLWLPYEIYRQTHIAHHATEHLTDPRHDPESRYLIQPTRAGAALAMLQSTLLGRLVLGPVIEIGRFLAREALALTRNDAGRRWIWAMHLLGGALVGVWVTVVCGMSLSRYVLCFVYPGAAFSLLRSYVEHRADAMAGRRIAVVEQAPILGLLFLNNNLHAAQRPDLVAQGAPVYRGYADVVRRYLVRPHDAAVYPHVRTTRGEGPG